MKVLLVGGSGFIGSHLAEDLVKNGFNVLSADLKNTNSLLNYVYLDLMDYNQTLKVIREFAPNAIVNLAAITVGSDSLTDYKVNYLGVLNLIRVLDSLEYECRLIHFSTQYVIAPHPKEVPEDKVAPVNTYGLSKKISEEILFNSGLTNFVIVRPTNIWGPRHPGFPSGIWKMIKKGLYLHPRKTVVRSYGWVGTVSEQTRILLEIESLDSIPRILYLGNEPIDSFKWVNSFSLRISGRSVRRIPMIVLKCLAIIGDLIKFFGYSSPIFSTRYKNMTTDYSIDMSQSFKILGDPIFNFDEAIESTASWYLNKDIQA